MERVQSVIPLDGLDSITINPREGTLVIRTRVAQAAQRLEPSAALNSWWDSNSMTTLMDNHIGLWFKRKADMSANNQGIVVNDMSDEMDFVRTEDKLEKALLAAKGAHLRAFDIAARVKSEVKSQHFYRGLRLRWAGEYMRDFINQLADNWKLSKTSREALISHFVKAKP